MKTSDLILSGSIVTENSFKINQNVDFEQWSNKEVRFQLKKTFGIATDDPQKVRLIIKVKLFDENFEENGEPFFLSVGMNFFFEVESEKFKKDEILDKYAYSMMGISFPYIRAFIASLSGLIGLKEVINVPAIDISSFFSD